MRGEVVTIRCSVKMAKLIADTVASVIFMMLFLEMVVLLKILRLCESSSLLSIFSNLIHDNNILYYFHYVFIFRPGLPNTNFRNQEFFVKNQ